MRPILLLSFLCSINFLHAQIEISAQAYSSGSAEAASSSQNISYTLGETIIFGGSNSNSFACQGFQNGIDNYTVSTIEIEGKSIEVNFFPNPSNGYINMEWDVKNKFHSVYLYDNLGRNVQSHAIEQFSHYTSIDASQLKDGLYMITVVDSQNQIHFVGKIILTK